MVLLLSKNNNNDQHHGNTTTRVQDLLRDPPSKNMKKSAEQLLLMMISSSRFGTDDNSSIGTNRTNGSRSTSSSRSRRRNSRSPSNGGRLRTTMTLHDRKRQIVSFLSQRVGFQNELWNRNRRIINRYIRRIGTSLLDGDPKQQQQRQQLSLSPLRDEDGKCFFPYKNFVFIIEVSKENPAICMFHAIVWVMQHRRKKSRKNISSSSLLLSTSSSSHSNAEFLVMKKAMEMNFMQDYTNGSTLGISGNQVKLCHSRPISRHDDAIAFQDAFEDFIDTAVRVRDELSKSATKRYSSSIPAERTNKNKQKEPTTPEGHFQPKIAKKK